MARDAQDVLRIISAVVCHMQGHPYAQEWDNALSKARFEFRWCVFRPMPRSLPSVKSWC